MHCHNPFLLNSLVQPHAFNEVHRHVCLFVLTVLCSYSIPFSWFHKLREYSHSRCAPAINTPHCLNTFLTHVRARFCVKIPCRYLVPFSRIQGRCAHTRCALASISLNCVLRPYVNKQSEEDSTLLQNHSFSVNKINK